MTDIFSKLAERTNNCWSDFVKLFWQIQKKTIVSDFTMNNTNNKQKEIGNESFNNEHMGARGHKDVRTGPDIFFANTLTLFHFFLNKNVYF